MNIVVCGGRDYDDYEKVISVLDSVHARVGITLLIEGGARGADAHAGTWANHNGVARATVHANWTYYGKKAGPIRNKTMLTLNPGGLVAFPGGIGTEGMIKLALEAGVKVMRVKK